MQLRDVVTLALVVGAASACGQPEGSSRSAGARSGGGEVVATEGSMNGAPPSPGGAGTSSTPEEDTTIVEMIAVRPGFQPDPIVRTGVGGGPVDASTLDESCRGYITAEQQYDLKVDAAMTSLRVLVHMSDDATLVIRLADGTYLCNDDSEGLNPIIGPGRIPPGRHRVFVGTYSPSGVGTRYTIAFTSQPGLTTHALDGMAITP